MASSPNASNARDLEGLRADRKTAPQAGPSFRTGLILTIILLLLLAIVATAVLGLGAAAVWDFVAPGALLMEAQR